MRGRLVDVPGAREPVDADLTDVGDGEVGVQRLGDRDGHVVEVRDVERERERALGLLVRRGFPLELAYDAVRATERRLREAA